MAGSDITDQVVTESGDEYVVDILSVTGSVRIDCEYTEPHIADVGWGEGISTVTTGWSGSTLTTGQPWQGTINKSEIQLSNRYLSKDYTTFYVRCEMDNTDIEDYNLGSITYNGSTA